MRVAAALFVALLLPGAAYAQTAAPSLDAIAPGTNVRALFARFGIPAVTTTNVGQIWTWTLADGASVRVTSDDDGVVQIADVTAKSGSRATLTLAGGTYALAFGAPPSANGVGISVEHAISGSLPDTGAPAQYWEYALPAARELVLAYAGAAGPLREALLGDRSALALAGFFPDTPVNAYKAPLLIELGSADYSGSATGSVFSRIRVAADGSVTDAAVFVSSGDARLDEIALAIARGSNFEPATRDGGAVPSVYFRREDFTRGK